MSRQIGRGLNNKDAKTRKRRGRRRRQTCSIVGEDSPKSEARRPKTEGNPKSERQLQKSSMTTKERKEHKERGRFPPLCGLCAPLRLVLQLAPEVRIGSASALPQSWPG